MKSGAKLASHKRVAYFSLLVLSAHALWFLVFSSLSGARKTSYKSYQAFRNWHKWISILLVAMSLHHVLTSGLYFPKKWQIFLIVVLSLGIFISKVSLRLRQFASQLMVLIGISAVLIFVLLRGGIL